VEIFALHQSPREQSQCRGPDGVCDAARLAPGPGAGVIIAVRACAHFRWYGGARNELSARVIIFKSQERVELKVEGTSSSTPRASVLSLSERGGGMGHTVNLHRPNKRHGVVLGEIESVPLVEKSSFSVIRRSERSLYSLARQANVYSVNATSPRKISRSSICFASVGGSGRSPSNSRC